MRARRHPHRRAQQRRRPRQSLDVLADHGPQGGGEPPASWPGRHRHANSAASTSFKEEFTKAGATRFGSRLGLARQWQGRQARRRTTPNQDSPLMDGQRADPRPRRLGARLLPELPKPPARLPQGVVERGRLEQGRRAVRGSQSRSPDDLEGPVLICVSFPQAGHG